MRLNVKRLTSWLSGFGVGLLALMTNAQASAQEYIEVLPEVGTVEMIAEGTYYNLQQEYLGSPAPGFRSYNIWATVKGDTTPGKFVNAFQELNITGVHQVWEPPSRPGRPPVQTPYSAYFEGFADKLQTLDSYAGWGEDDQSNGASPSETNDGSNPAGIDPAVFDPDSGLVDGDVVIGVGEVGVTSRGAAPAALGLATQSFRQMLAHIVLWDGVAAADGHYTTATLHGDIGGEGDGNEVNGGEIDNFANVTVGAPMLVEVPEPAAGLAALLGLVSLAGLRRRS
jgi:hypothetical protein